MVHASRGRLSPAREQLLPRSRSSAGLARDAVRRRPRGAVADVRGRLRPIRGHIEHVVPGFADYDEQRPRARRLRAAARAARLPRVHARPTGKAHFTRERAVSTRRCPPAGCCCRRSAATTSSTPPSTAWTTATAASRAAAAWCSCNPDDLGELGLADGDLVDLGRSGADGERRAPAFRLVVATRRRAAARPRTSPRPTCWCRSTRWPTSRTRRCRRRSSCGWSLSPDIRAAACPPCR